MVEDPPVFVFARNAFSVDEPLSFLKRKIRDSYRQTLLRKSSERRKDCTGPQHDVDILCTRKSFLSQHNPLCKQTLRYILTGTIDHASRLYQSMLVSTPTCPFCLQSNETAQHIFWECDSWKFIRIQYPNLMRLYFTLFYTWYLMIMAFQWLPSLWLDCR